jgi:hypothetical protein
MPSYAQRSACDPHAFIEAGQTYQRMAQGFGRVRAAFRRGLAVLDANWQGCGQGRGHRPRPAFGHLGPVEREVIDRVTAPTGIIGAEPLTAWTRHDRDS